MAKPILKKILRSLGIIELSDLLRYRVMKFKNRRDNKAFKDEFPDIPIPPDYILYEAHQLKYRSYFNNGLHNAKELKKHFERHLDLKDKKILDWGCGPARIIRHFPDVCQSTAFVGTDYNRSTIAWNKTYINNVEFYLNEINPPTVFEENTFDGIYSLSVLTHLSEENHYNWISELYRILKPNGVLLISTHGDAFKEKLTSGEQAVFNKNKLVVQDNTLEGHRTFAAYHPPHFMKTLFESKFEVLEHLPGKIESWGTSQDTWIVRCLK